jgi:hypothetical protein
MHSIPMFPLSILPLPGELVPLHIFEPRYKQLLEHAEAKDFSFGIFFNHAINTEKIGARVKLESVIKRYPSGESDIIVKCDDMFTLDTMYRTFKSKLYPGGEVKLWNVNLQEIPKIKLIELFHAYMARRNITRQQSFFSTFEIAQELSLEINDRYTFLLADENNREKFLIQRIKYQMDLLQHEEKSKDVFHLN